MHRHASYVLFCTQEKDRFIRAQVLYISMQYSSFKWPVLTATHFWVSARLSSLFDTDRAPACPTSTLRCADYKSRWWVQLLMAIRSFSMPITKRISSASTLNIVQNDNKHSRFLLKGQQHDPLTFNIGHKLGQQANLWWYWLHQIYWTYH